MHFTLKMSVIAKFVTRTRVSGRAIFGQQTVCLFPTVIRCANGALVLDIMLAGWMSARWLVC